MYNSKITYDRFIQKEGERARQTKHCDNDNGDIKMVLNESMR